MINLQIERVNWFSSGKGAAFYAYFASVSIVTAFHRLRCSSLSTSLYVSLLSRLCDLHSCSTCPTVCRSLLLSHLPLSNPGTLLPYRKVFNPILPVRTRVTSTPNLFQIPPWMQRTDLDVTSVGLADGQWSRGMTNLAS